MKNETSKLKKAFSPFFAKLKMKFNKKMFERIRKIKAIKQPNLQWVQLLLI